MDHLPRRYWHEMRSADFAHVDPERWVALMPVGAVEQHGPHLPLAVDATINAAIVARALERAPPQLPLTVLPMTWIGRSEEHVDYPGTLTLSAETLRRTWYEIGVSVARAGLRKLVIFNSHGGQIQVMQIVARQLRVDHELFVAAVSWPQLGLPEGVATPVERAHGIHAGELETSLMLAARPDLVSMDRALDFPPLIRRIAEQFPMLAGLGPAGFGWKAQDLHASGAAGDAARGAAATGDAVLAHLAERLLALVDEVVRYPLANLRPPPP